MLTGSRTSDAYLTLTNQNMLPTHGPPSGYILCLTFKKSILKPVLVESESPREFLVLGKRNTNTACYVPDNTFLLIIAFFGESTSLRSRDFISDSTHRRAQARNVAE
ncbi:hypothetical protein M378DRAFT_622521 [Amanita muscaria Koide BX008]|uniref:Uncharacterized protein n=1 Tax=Amanita muscaria (strain Koide BX008) TaxID=946122 RepID=A0A0C2X7V1_AMAMK|nr:hypothetical protein M378DRAFT_622521 [Amanita muscaria Koide BX008]